MYMLEYKDLSLPEFAFLCTIFWIYFQLVLWIEIHNFFFLGGGDLGYHSIINPSPL